MGTEYANVRLTDSAGAALMYFPIASTIEEVRGNALNRYALPWSRGGEAIADLHIVTGEIVIQGTFVSTDAPGDADWITALRALNPVAWAAPHVITAREQWNWLLNELITTTGGLRLYYNDDEFRYATALRDIAVGDYPPVVWKDCRVIGEAGKDRLDFTLRFVVGRTSLEKA